MGLFFHFEATLRRYSLIPTPSPVDDLAFILTLQLELVSFQYSSYSICFRKKTLNFTSSRLM